MKKPPGYELRKKPPGYELGGFIYPGAGLSFRAVTRQVLSLLTVFTFVFGMGTGVFQPHQHQEPFVTAPERCAFGLLRQLWLPSLCRLHIARVRIP